RSSNYRRRRCRITPLTSWSETPIRPSACPKVRIKTKQRKKGEFERAEHCERPSFAAEPTCGRSQGGLAISRQRIAHRPAPDEYSRQLAPFRGTEPGRCRDDGARRCLPCRPSHR